MYTKNNIITSVFCDNVKLGNTVFTQSYTTTFIYLFKQISAIIHDFKGKLSGNFLGLEVKFILHTFTTFASFNHVSRV
mgnify:CR=1 FL=1